MRIGGFVFPRATVVVNNNPSASIPDNTRWLQPPFIDLFIILPVEDRMIWPAYNGYGYPAMFVENSAPSVRPVKFVPGGYQSMLQNNGHRRGREPWVHPSM